MQASRQNQKEVAKVLMEARADPFLRNEDVRSISILLFPFHVFRVKQQEIWLENRVILILKDCWRIMREISVSMGKTFF